MIRGDGGTFVLISKSTVQTRAGGRRTVLCAVLTTLPLSALGLVRSVLPSAL